MACIGVTTSTLADLAHVPKTYGIDLAARTFVSPNLLHGLFADTNVARELQTMPGNLEFNIFSVALATAKKQTVQIMALNTPRRILRIVCAA